LLHPQEVEICPSGITSLSLGLILISPTSSGVGGDSRDFYFIISCTFFPMRYSAQQLLMLLIENLKLQCSQATAQELCPLRELGYGIFFFFCGDCVLEKNMETSLPNQFHLVIEIRACHTHAAIF
jgi:hypothetical protein